MAAGIGRGGGRPARLICEWQVDIGPDCWAATVATPTARGDYAAFMNNLPKVVFSKTLPAVGWAGSRIARGDLPEEIAALKSESGGKIIMAHGGATFVQALSRLALIDEYRLVILPVALGNGLPLFKDLAKPLRVDLAGAESFPDGTVIHVYQPIAAHHERRADA